MIDLHEVRARDLMSPSLVDISARASLHEAARLMSERSIHGLVVLPTEPSRGLGIITSKDVVQLLADGDTSVLPTIEVGDVMSCPAVGVQGDLCIADCVKLMLMAGVRRVVVMDGGEAIGLLSNTDVVAAVATD